MQRHHPTRTSTPFAWFLIVIAIAVLSGVGVLVSHATITVSGSGITGNSDFNSFTVPGIPPASSSSQLLELGPNTVSGGSTTGTYVGINPSSFSGDFLNFQINSSTKFKIDSSGNIGANELYGTTVATPSPNLSFDGSGGININAGGTDQSITLTPSGIANTILGANGLQFPDGTVQTTTASGGDTLGTTNGGFSNKDEAPGSPSAYDDEFNGSSLGAAWTIDGSVSGDTVEVRNGVASLFISGWNANHSLNIYRSLPTSTPWTFVAKFSATQFKYNYGFVGIEVKESGTGKDVLLSVGTGGNGYALYLLDQTGAIGAMPNVSIGNWIYLALRSDGTYLYPLVSWDGITYGSVWGNNAKIAIASYFTTAPDQFSLQLSKLQGGGSGDLYMDVDYVRACTTAGCMP